MKSTQTIITISCLALWAQLGLSVPTASTTSTLINSTYDDYEATPVTNKLNGPLTIYDGLMYSSFGVFNSTGEVSGLEPHSKPNYISSSVTQQLTAVPSVTVVYSDSPYSSFSLISFWFGCGDTAGQGDVTSTASCTLQVTSYRNGSSNPVATTNFDFAPPVSDLTSAPMVMASLPAGYTNVQKVVFQQTPSANEGLGMDNMVFDLNW